MIDGVTGLHLSGATRTRGSRRSGQAMIEYMIVAVMMIGLVALFALLLYALRQQSGRVLELVASEYP